MSRDLELLAIMAECEKTIAHAQATQIEALAEFCEIRDDDFASTEVAAELNWCDANASHYLITSVELIERLPRVLEALSEGRIDMPRVWRYVDHARHLSDEHASIVADRTLPRAESQTPGELVRFLSKVVRQVDPKGVEERKAEAKRRRSVSMYPKPDDMANLNVFMPAPDATAVINHLEYLAKKATTPDDERTLEEIKVDIFTDPIFGRNPIHATVNVIVPITTLMGTDDKPGELAGYGPVTASTARELAFRDAVWRRLVTDPINGTLKDCGRTTYRPPADLNDLVRARDVTCRFPGAGVAQSSAIWITSPSTPEVGRPTPATC